MKLNKDNCHLLKSGYKYKQAWSVIGGERNWEANNVELLGIAKLKFNMNVLNMRSKSNNKLDVLTRILNSSFVH